MFFRKSKRIKELTAKYNALMKEINAMRSLLAKETAKVDHYDIETLSVEVEYGPQTPDDIAISEAFYLLNKQIKDYAIVKTKYNEIRDVSVKKVQLKVVKEQ